MRFFNSIKIQVIVILLVSLLLAFLFYNSYGVFISPDEMGHKVLVDQISEQENFKPVILPYDFLDLVHPRNTVSVNSTLLPQSFVGNILIDVTISKMVGSNFDFLLILIKLFLFLSGIFLLIKNNVAISTNLIFSAILVVSISPLLHMVGWSLIFFVFSLYFLLKDNFHYWLLGIFFIVITCLSRYEFLIFFSFLLVFFLIFKKYQILLPIIFALSLSLITILLTNSYLYGDFFTLGYSFDPQASDTAFYESTGFFTKIISYVLPYGINFSSIFSNFLTYFIFLLPLLILGMFGLGVKLFHFKNKPFIFSAMYFSLMLCFIVYYYSNPNFFTLNNPSMTDSYVRYLLFFIIIAKVYAMFILLRVFEKKSLVLFVISLSIIVFFIPLVDFHNERTATWDRYSLLLERVVENTGDEAIIFAGYWDKVLWKERLVATRTYFNVTDQQKQQFAETLFENNHTLYVYDDHDFYLFFVSNYELERVPGTNLYKVLN